LDGENALASRVGRHVAFANPRVRSKGSRIARCVALMRIVGLGHGLSIKATFLFFVCDSQNYVNQNLASAASDGGKVVTDRVILYLIIVHDPPFSGEEIRMWRLIDPKARCNRNKLKRSFVRPTLAQRSNMEGA
jgi:hypothetical protein